MQTYHVLGSVQPHIFFRSFVTPLIVSWIESSMHVPQSHHQLMQITSRIQSLPSLFAPRDFLALGIDSGISYVPHCQFISPELVGDDGKGDYFRSSALLFPLSINRVRLIGQVDAHDRHGLHLLQLIRPPSGGFTLCWHPTQ